MATFEKNVGSRVDVWKGVAKKTSGGLEKKDLRMSASKNKIVSKRMSDNAKRNNYLGDFLVKKKKSPSKKKGSPKKASPVRRSARLAAKQK